MQRLRSVVALLLQALVAAGVLPEGELSRQGLMTALGPGGHVTLPFQLSVMSSARRQHAAAAATAATTATMPTPPPGLPAASARPVGGAAPPPRQPFDARPVLLAEAGFDGGRVRAPGIYLISRDPPPTEQEYYRSEAVISFP